MSETSNIKTFGILLDKFSISQRDVCINVELNKMMQQYYDLSPIVFFEDYARNVQVPLFARYLIKDVFCFKAPVISNDIKSALLLQKCICPTRRLLYMWDLEWITNRIYDFDTYRSIYYSFEIIARSNQHAELIEKVWRKPDFIVEDFNYEDIRQIIIG